MVILNTQLGAHLSNVFSKLGIKHIIYYDQNLGNEMHSFDNDIHLKMKIVSCEIVTKLFEEKSVYQSFKSTLDQMKKIPQFSKMNIICKSSHK